MYMYKCTSGFTPLVHWYGIMLNYMYWFPQIILKKWWKFCFFASCKRKATSISPILSLVVKASYFVKISHMWLKFFHCTSKYFYKSVKGISNKRRGYCYYCKRISYKLASTGLQQTITILTSSFSANVIGIQIFSTWTVACFKVGLAVAVAVALLNNLADIYPWMRKYLYLHVHVTGSTLASGITYYMTMKISQTFTTWKPPLSQSLKIKVQHV